MPVRKEKTSSIRGLQDVIFDRKKLSNLSWSENRFLIYIKTQKYFPVQSLLWILNKKEHIRWWWGSVISATILLSNY